MEVKLDDESVKAIVTAAIMKQLDDPEKLVADAVKYLISTKTVGTGYNKTETQPIQEAFHNAIERHATQVIQESLRENEALNAAIRKIATDALTEIFEHDGITLASAVAAAIGKKLSEAKLGRWD